MSQVKSVNDLKESCVTDGQGFYILLDGGIISRKFISYEQRSKKFFVDNYIDGSNQRLTSRQLYTQSNIGKAIERGRFYRDE
jgi:hypothetical protein